MAGKESVAAADLRKAFEDIPKAQRDEHRAFSIRVWRGLSWLDRCQAAGEADLESRFICLWIAFNAIYGCFEEGTPAADHAGWQAFLARVHRVDTHGLLMGTLWDDQRLVLKLIDTKYLFRPFWLGDENCTDKLRRSHQVALRALADRNGLLVLQELFERLYTMRQQVFHGAATSGSKLNRTTLKQCVHALGLLVPAMIQIMIKQGPQADWGEVCFPPVDNRVPTVKATTANVAAARGAAPA